MNQDNENLDNIAKMFGLVMINWGGAEQSFDMLIAILWQLFPETHSYSKKKKIPVMLTAKINFARGAFANIQELKSFEIRAEVVIAEFDRLSTTRNDLTHGAIASFEPINDHIVLIKFDVSENFHHTREVPFPITAYPKLIKDLVNLGKNAHELTNDVFKFAKALKPDSTVLMNGKD